MTSNLFVGQRLEIKTRKMKNNENQPVSAQSD
jgi:hypothetical protein